MHCISRHCCGRRHLHSAGVSLRVQPGAEAIAFIGRIIIMAVRTVPAFIYGLMFIRVTGPGAFAGLLTMSLCSVGMVSKMYIEAIEDLDVRVLESLDAADAPPGRDPLWHPASADAQLRFHRHLPF